MHHDGLQSLPSPMFTESMSLHTMCIPQKVNFFLPTDRVLSLAYHHCETHIDSTGLQPVDDAQHQGWPQALRNCQFWK